MGESMTKVIRLTLAKGEFDRSLNHSLISLIPKADVPDSMKQMRPIALCNVLVKVVTKLLANRIKLLMAKIISAQQCSFAPGHHTTDNIVIAHEALHSMGRKKSKKGFFLPLNWI